MPFASRLAGAMLWAFLAAQPAAAETPAPGAEPAGAPAASTAPVIDWDRAANIKDAAERLAKVQRAQGADGAIKYIDACYRTHGLAENYSAPFEGCIAQDYLLTKMLTRIYSRLPPETLQKLRAPSPDDLAQSMGRRVVAAFSQYKVPAATAEAFRAEVDTHGLPAFLKLVFPNAAGEIDALEKKRVTPDAKPKDPEKK